MHNLITRARQGARLIRERASSGLSAVGLLIMSSVAAHAEDVDPIVDLTTKVNSIKALWGLVAAIIIGVSVVMVGRKFFKKLG